MPESPYTLETVGASAEAALRQLSSLDGKVCLVAGGADGAPACGVA